jgi:hypothetical protein
MFEFLLVKNIFHDQQGYPQGCCLENACLYGFVGIRRQIHKNKFKIRDIGFYSIRPFVKPGD